eukprot:TRINITY_DN12645_c0_g1_i2.p1 TRINITY_DN12645_c0_g1~~TRINITY_DN12645_c0_g1_i2.p1  ORF type:complete len:218 (+),score=26.25 TRINITY_DN12645_c0_g1_i2:215-868(+)
MVWMQFAQIESALTGSIGSDCNKDEWIKTTARAFNFVGLGAGTLGAFFMGALANVHYKQDPKVHLTSAALFFTFTFIFMLLHSFIPIMTCILSQKLSLSLMIVRLFFTGSGSIFLALFTFTYTRGMKSIFSYDPLDEDEDDGEEEANEIYEKAQEDINLLPQLTAGQSDEPTLRRKPKYYPKNLVYGALLQYSAITSVGLYYVTFYWSLKGVEFVLK